MVPAMSVGRVEEQAEQAWLDTHIGVLQQRDGTPQHPEHRHHPGRQPEEQDGHPIEERVPGDIERVQPQPVEHVEARGAVVHGVDRPEPGARVRDAVCPVLPQVAEQERAHGGSQQGETACPGLASDPRRHARQQGRGSDPGQLVGDHHGQQVGTVRRGVPSWAVPRWVVRPHALEGGEPHHQGKERPGRGQRHGSSCPEQGVGHGRRGHEEDRQKRA